MFHQPAAGLNGHVAYGIGLTYFTQAVDDGRVGGDVAQAQARYGVLFGQGVQQDDMRQVNHLTRHQKRRIGIELVRLVNNEDVLLLVNGKHPLPKAYKPQLVGTEYYKEVDARAKAPLEKMLNDCRAAGHKPLLCSAYRSVAFQKELIEDKIDSLRRQGYSEAEAKKEASVWIATPGTSEHHTGLAVDIVDIDYQLLDEKQEDTATQKWLMQNCSKYGFILRYPTEKKAITRINYEPWHYRYVGVENAKKITASGLCLEEYVLKINQTKQK